MARVKFRNGFESEVSDVIAARMAAKGECRVIERSVAPLDLGDGKLFGDEPEPQGGAQDEGDEGDEPEPQGRGRSKGRRR